MFSQITFTNTYNNDTVSNVNYSGDECHSIFEYKNSLYTLGTFAENKEDSPIQNGVPDTTHAIIMKFNQSGDLLQQDFVTANSCYTNFSRYILSNGYLIACGAILSPKNFCNSYNPDYPPPGIDEIIKRKILVNYTNLDKNESKQIVYRTGVDSYPFGVVESYDNNIIIGNIVEKDRVMCLLKVNYNGDSLSNKIFFDSIPADYEPIFFDKTDNGYIIALTSYANNATHIDLLNKEGDIIGYKNFNFLPIVIEKTNDGGLVLLQNIGGKPQLTVMNKNLEIEWTRIYDLYNSYYVKQTSDNNFLIGTKDFAKVDKDSIIWKRRYFGESNILPWYYIRNATETADGGIALTGYYEFNTFLVKTDCKGNLIWDETLCKIPEPPKQFAAGVYPNPFNNEITFSFPELTDSTIKIKITNMLGQIVFNGETNTNLFSINTSTYPQAIYIYSIYDNNRVYKSGKIVKQ